MAADRLRRINEQLRTILAQELSRAVELSSGTIVSITQVRTSADLKTATVLVSILPERCTGSVLHSLQAHMPYFVSAVRQQVPLRSLPHFRFTVDTTERRAGKIEALLDSLAKTG
ncbi:MAG: 30S ribosome-binding factor RbfA [Candidatus Kerfeldbacteria bacterium]|nr:30S ribosome-binding factor RbfA [Candidatus Kerfeldbacteria bacterium]